MSGDAQNVCAITVVGTVLKKSETHNYQIRATPEWSRSVKILDYGLFGLTVSIHDFGYKRKEDRYFILSMTYCLFMF